MSIDAFSPPSRGGGRFFDSPPWGPESGGGIEDSPPSPSNQGGKKADYPPSQEGENFDSPPSTSNQGGAGGDRRGEFLSFCIMFSDSSVCLRISLQSINVYSGTDSVPERFANVERRFYYL